MAETKQEEQLAEVQEGQAEAPQDSPAEAPQDSSAEAPKKAAANPYRRSILIPLLTVLLILIGIGEAVFWGYFGFSAYARSLARERYEQQQKVLKEEWASKGITGGSSYSPNLRVENGTVTWEREKWAYAGSGQPTNTSTVPRREDGLRLARLPIVRIPYTLAEMDADWEAPSAGPETEMAEGEATPTST